MEASPSDNFKTMASKSPWDAISKKMLQQSHLAEARGRASQLESPANPQEIIGMRVLVGSLSWTTREDMPQGAGEASLVASCFPEPLSLD